MARSAVTTMLRACESASGTEILDLLNTPARAVFVASGGVHEGCEAVLGLVPPAEQATLEEVFANAGVAAIDVHDGSAAVVVTTARGSKSTVEAEDVRGEWHVGLGSHR